jgi:hypothetical protein
MISFIILMKVAGEFFKPKGMTNHSNRPSFDLKVVFYTYVCSMELVVARLQINLTEVFVPLEMIKEFVDSGNQVLVPECDFI